MSTSAENLIEQSGALRNLHALLAPRTPHAATCVCDECARLQQVEISERTERYMRDLEHLSDQACETLSYREKDPYALNDREAKRLVDQFHEFIERDDDETGLAFARRFAARVKARIAEAAREDLESGR